MVVTGKLAAGTLKGRAGQRQHPAILAAVAAPPATFTLAVIAGGEGWWQQEAETCLGHMSTGHCK